MAEQQQQSTSQAQTLSNAVEREVRMALGDLHMQIIVLRQMLELAQQGQPQPHTAQPTPLRPVPDMPGPTESSHRRPNGGGA